jgi:hypothetical protein
MRLTIDPSTLPVAEALPALRAALESGRNAVLVAPPGAGKTTLVPLALADTEWAAAGMKGRIPMASTTFGGGTAVISGTLIESNTATGGGGGIRPVAAARPVGIFSPQTQPRSSASRTRGSPPCAPKSGASASVLGPGMVSSWSAHVFRLRL